VAGDIDDMVPTPSLLVEIDTFDANLRTMGAAHPGPRLRTHVKAFKSTAMASRVAAAGHPTFCCATVREVEGMAAAGLGADLLLANEVLDARRLGAVAATGARVTVAVDSDQTIDAAATGGVGEVLIDVNVGLPRCGCDPADAGRLADRARAAGLAVRGVMGYEGHVVGVADRSERIAGVASAMEQLVAAHAAVGGEVISAGGTGTWDINTWATELQAGSFLLMDTDYSRLDIPFGQALFVLGRVISTNPGQGYAVADVGLKSLGMDHGKPSIDGHSVWFCSDEHVTFAPRDDRPLPAVGDLIRVVPAHVDPTVARHEVFHVVRGHEKVDEWPIDLRHW
jgi:D-serine deaminase-like pyridoxal phosphate-dependent protein